MVANLRLLPVLLLLLLEAGVGEAGEDSTTLDPGAKTSSVTLSEGNLRANKAPYWAGAWATAAAPTAAGQWSICSTARPSYESLYDVCYDIFKACINH